MTAPIQWFTDALQLLGTIGSGESAPVAEDAEVCRRTLNRMLGQWNTRKRNAYYIRTQSWAFATAKEEYTIGAAADTPDFAVTAGGSPNRIESASVIFTDIDPNNKLQLAVINFDQYDRIQIPTLPSIFPNALYYKRTFPNGTLKPWPAFPSFTSYKLFLAWWNQFVAVAAADIAVDVPLPDGWDAAIVLNLAVSLYPAFPKKTDIEELKRQAGDALGDVQSLNVPPPTINSTDGIGRAGGGFNYRTRQFI